MIETEMEGDLQGERDTHTQTEGEPLGVASPGLWALHAVLWRGVEQALSAKFAQEQLVLVRNFRLSSHKTKHCVKHLQRLLGEL